MTRSSIRRACASTLAIVAFVAPAINGQALELPAPRGPYALGTTILHWVDAARAETSRGHERERRELMVQLWYPAAPSTLSFVPYVPEFTAIAAHAKELNAHGLALLGGGINRLRDVRAHARLDAPVLATGSPWPVVLFSPGNSVPRSIYTVLVEDLASRGFVVAAIDHPYTVAIVVLPGGRVAMQDPDEPGASFEARVAVRAEDLRFALDEITRANAADGGAFAGRLDLSHVGAFGHSLGGVAAVQIAASDRRFTAVANLDGGTGEIADNIERNRVTPLLLVTKSTAAESAPTDQTLKTWGLSRTQYEALMAEERRQREATYGAMTSVAYRITVAGAQHMNFSDAPYLERDNRGIDAVRALRITSDYLAAFFERFLYERPSVLLDGPSSAHPETHWERVPR